MMETMSDWVKVKASDGHELSSYVARPKGEVIGALVLVQEIYGVNSHVRSVADGYAKDGFLVVAPAIFDRFERGLELKYEGADQKRAMQLYPMLKPDVTLLDVAAAYGEAKKAGKGIGVIGYCYGGLISWLTATRGENLKMQPSCCVGYYPGGVGSVAKEDPSCPVMLHFGRRTTTSARIRLRRFARRILKWRYSSMRVRDMRLTGTSILGITTLLQRNSPGSAAWPF